MYRYDEYDEKFVGQRVAQFRRQVTRRLAGELTEDQFRPLRLMNGLYLQLHAYMLRVNVPYGTLSSRQMRQFAHVARKYDKGFGHFTTRQNIQYNWIKLAEAPDAISDLGDVAVTTIQSSGNCVRNITSDQYAGCAKDELADPRIYCELLRQYSFLHPEFSYLPRKFKIAITGSPNDRAAVAIHDIGLRMHKNEHGEVGFEVLVGGGLGRTPYIGQTIRKWLAPEHLLSYVEAILRVYNMLGRRDNIHKARIKIIVNQMGIDKYRELVDKEWELIKDGVLKVPDEEVERIEAYFAPPPYEKLVDQSAALASLRRADRNFERWMRGNVVEHKVPGYAIVNISLKAPGRVPGDITADRMDAVADLADRYSFGEIRVNHRQNLVFVDVKQRELHELWRKLVVLELATPNLGLLTDIICCPGLDYCALANARSIPIAQDISHAFTDLDELQRIGNFTINISGCMNACGHHHVGHIGILGVDKRGEEFFQLTLGGSSDQRASLGDRLGPGLPQADVPGAIRKIVDTYMEIREGEERFLDTYRRVGMEPFKGAVYGAEGSAAHAEAAAAH
jgi:sulfite reductase (NADPH) hemoprotein beta-component